MSLDEIRKGFLLSEEYQKKNAPVSTLSPVQQFQFWLNSRLPIGLAIDGSLGPLTKKAAVMDMQEYLNSTYDARLSVDGSFGPASRRAYHTVCRLSLIHIYAPGNFSIQNLTNGSFSRFHNLSAGEKLTMEKTGSGLLSSLPSHAILDDFDKNWISLTDGANELLVEGDASLTLTYREPRKAGV